MRKLLIAKHELIERKGKLKKNDEAVYVQQGLFAQFESITSIITSFRPHDAAAAAAAASNCITGPC